MFSNYFTLLPWHAKPWQLLYRCHQARRLPHALLLVGQAGLGKALFAANFAKTLLCQQPNYLNGNTDKNPSAKGSYSQQWDFCQGAEKMSNRSVFSIHEDCDPRDTQTISSAKSILMACQHCRDCVLTTANTHPDLCWLTVEKSGQAIKIDQIRAVIERLNHTSRSTYKIIVINPVDSLVLAASHALLKSLEEPSDRTLFILLTEKIESLLPTLRSRCQVIRFIPPEKSVAMAWLKQQLPESSESPMDKLYHFAAGAPLLALTYAQQNYYSFYTDLLTSLVHLLDQKLDPIRCAATYVKKDAQQLLSTLLHVVSELLKCQLLNGYTGIEGVLTHLAHCLSTDFLFQYFDSLMRLKAHTAKISLNLQLILEDLFSRWALQGLDLREK